MKRRLSLFGALVQPWLTALVYLWSLELLASFSTLDPEPLFDRVADCAAILLTLALWTCAAASVLWLMAWVCGRTTLVVNEIAVRVAIIGITVLYFVRWMLNWGRLLGDPDIGVYVVGVAVVIVGLWAWRRRSKGIPVRESQFSLEDGWSCFAAPVLIVALALVSLKIGGNFWIRGMGSGSSVNASGPRVNIVMVVADALRQQNMSLYGYHRKTTPFLDRFAEESDIYTQMHSNSTSTRPSLTTILSGKHPLSHGRLTKFLPLYENPENLVALLREAGYTTAAVTSNSDATFYLLGFVKFLVHGEYPNFRRLTLSFLRDNGVYPTSPGTRMYDELARWFPFLGYPQKTLGYGPAGDTVDVASRLMNGLPEPFFLFVHLHEPHDPYHAPPPFRGKYSKLDYAAVNKKIPADHYGSYRRELQVYVDGHRDHYDEAIEYLDSQLESLVKSLRSDARMRNTLWVITGDHGESFERGFLNHGEDLYESSIHVPLVIKLPNQANGARLSVPVQSIDIAPTILGAASLPVPQWMDGAALGRARALEAREKIIINYKDPAQGKIYEQPTKLAIRWRQYKMIVTCNNGRAELYDLSRDPEEQSNLSAAEPALARELWDKAERKLAKQKGEKKMECRFNPVA